MATQLPLDLVVVDVEVLHLGPVGDVLRDLLDAVVGRLEAPGVLDQLLVLEDLLGQLLHQNRVERHVERLDAALATDDLALGDVPAQLRRQSDHLAARTHRRDRLLVLLANHCPVCCESTITVSKVNYTA